MKRVISVVLIAFVLTSNLWAAWAMFPLHKVVDEADLIVVGTLYSADEDGEGIGRGYIKVEEIVSSGARTLEDRPLQIGDSLKIKWADNWACAAGMHMGRRGVKGIWLLDVDKDGTVGAAHPGKFEELKRLDEIRQLLTEEKSRVAVDVLLKEAAITSPPGDKIKVVTVDVSPFPDNSLTRAAITLLLFSALYWVLYRSRYRIR